MRGKLIIAAVALSISVLTGCEEFDRTANSDLVLMGQRVEMYEKRLNRTRVSLT